MRFLRAASAIQGYLASTGNQPDAIAIERDEKRHDPSPSYLQIGVQKSQRQDHTKTESNRLLNRMGRLRE
jgi:hypothetical protein